MQAISSIRFDKLPLTEKTGMPVTSVITSLVLSCVINEGSIRGGKVMAQVVANMMVGAPADIMTRRYEQNSGSVMLVTLVGGTISKLRVRLKKLVRNT